MRYSIEPRDRIYVKEYGLLLFVKNMGKILSNKYGQKFLDSAKKFKTKIAKRSSLYDYSDVYILVKGNITVNNTAADGAAANNTNNKIIFKSCAPFTDFITKINNTEIDHAGYIDIVMLMYNLIEYSDNYSKTYGNLWEYCKEIPAVNDNSEIVNFRR